MCVSPSFQPQICARSDRLVQSTPYVSFKCHERLYSECKPGAFKDAGRMTMSSEDLSRYTDMSISQQRAFVPKVSRMSREIIRTEPICNRLYKDALRRRNKVQPPVPVPRVPASAKSVSILVKRFLKELDLKSKPCQSKFSSRCNYFSRVRHTITNVVRCSDSSLSNHCESDSNHCESDLKSKRILI